MNEIEKPSEAMDQALELGKLLGQRQAFSAVAGRCTAAQVDAMRRMRDGKLYLHFASNWGEYCLEFLKVTSRHTNRQIACLQEFGPVYFELAQLTGITPAAYRLIAPAVESDGIHLEGEVIALIPENASQAAEAVTRLRAAAEAKAAPPPDIAAQLAALERRGRQVANAFADLAESNLDAGHRRALLQSVQDVRPELLRVEVGIL